MDIYHAIVRPLVTEKGTFQSRLSHPATKSRPQIRSAIEKIYNVKVKLVRTSNRLGKPRRVRYKRGRTRGWKKAVVILDPNYHIDLF